MKKIKWFLLFFLPLSVNGQSAALDLYNQARDEYQAGSYEKALTDLDRAISLNSDYAWACHKLKAEIQVIQKDPIAAIYEYNRVLELNPADAASWIGRAEEKLGLKDYSGALKDFNRGLELNPGASEALLSRGIAKGALGDKTGSCSDWFNALEKGNTKAKPWIDKFCSY